MSLVLNVLQTVMQQSSQFIAQRTDLNLPEYTTDFPFSYQQKQAINLALSNAPVTAIAGTPGSGKTEIALAALKTAIQHQRSTLVICAYESNFSKYQDLPSSPLIFTNKDNDRQSVKDWIMRELEKNTINFLPLYWLEDKLFEQLQTLRSSEYWLDLLRGDSESKDEHLYQEISKVLPNLNPHRQCLLVHRLKKSVTLLEHRARLSQSYQNLSEHSIEQIVDAALPHLKVPRLCLFENVELLKNNTFDLVIIEDSQALQGSTLKAIAQCAKKLVLLGELNGTSNLFNRLWNKLYPAYRLRLKENHRLHSNLARKIFPSLFVLTPNIYTPFNAKHKPLQKGTYRLNWLDIRASDQLVSKLQKSICESEDQDNATSILGILGFTSELTDRLKQNLPKYVDLIDSIQNWRGKECDELWIICDSSDPHKPDFEAWQLALTRASHRITILGNWQQYEDSPHLQELVSQFHFERDLELDQED